MRMIADVRTKFQSYRPLELVSMIASIISLPIGIYSIWKFDWINKDVIIGALLLISVINLIVTRSISLNRIQEIKLANKRVNEIQDDATKRIAYYKNETIQYQEECEKLFDLNQELSRQLGEHIKIGGNYTMGGNLAPSTPEDEMKTKIHDHIRQKIE